MSEKTAEKSDLIEKVLKVNRVAKVVKGGRRFSFSALVVVGDGKSRVGVGLGKANEVTEAIRKGVERATKAMKPISLEGRTVPHEVRAVFGSARVIVKPAPAGHGIVASGTARAVMEAAGVSDISVKNVGSRNPHNVVKATLDALYHLRSHEEIAARRGVSLDRVRQVAAH